MALKPEAKIYVEKARKAYKAAQILKKEVLWEDSFSRAYYAVLDLSKAILVSAGLDVPKTHSGLVATLWANRSKLKVLETTIQNISRHQALREGGDYGVITNIEETDLRRIFEDINALFKHLGERND